MQAYENALRVECGYNGATPYVLLLPMKVIGFFDRLLYRYWDWTQDADESKPYVL